MLVLLGTLVSFYFMTNLKVEYDLKSFYPEKDPDLEFYNKFCKNFGSDDNLLMIAICHKDGIFNSTFISELDSFTRACNDLKWINDAYSITNLKDIRRTPFGILSYPILNKNDVPGYKTDSTIIMNDPRLTGWFISKDGRTVTVVLEAEDNLDDKTREILITNIEDLINEYSFSEIHIGGNIYTQVSYIRMIERDTVKSIILCSIVVITFLIILYRSFSRILIPALTVILGMIYFYGYLGFSHKPLNIMSTLFPTLMLVVGMSDLIHIFSKYSDELRNTSSRKDAIYKTMKEVGLTIFLTSLTTATGFIALTTSSIKPIKNFGIDAAIGILIAYVLAATFTPSILMMIKKPAIAGRPTHNRNWEMIINKIYFQTTNHPGRIIMISLIILLVSIFGILQISTNNHIIGFASNRTGIKKDYMFFENHLSGVRPFEIAVQAGNGHTMNEPAVLEEIEKLENYLNTKTAIGTLYTPATVYKSINKAYASGRINAYRLPENPSLIKRYDKIVEEIPAGLKGKVLDKEKKTGRIYGKMEDLGRNDVSRLLSEIDEWVENNIESSLVSFRHTGSALLADKNNDHLIRSMFISLAIAFSIISIIMTILFRNLKMVVISLIPNIFPLLFVGALLGYTGIELDGSISMIFTIGFVIAVDDTIHFLSKFKLEYQKDSNVSEAIRKTLHGTGKPIIITSLILFFGYLAICYSTFKVTCYHGLLVSITLFSALIADLFLTPVFLKLFLTKKVIERPLVIIKKYTAMKTNDYPVFLPYEGKRVPHIVIEVNQACNIQCSACYKHKYKYQKPLKLILEEIDLAISARDIHVITIAGGEPTLHPQLPEVIRYISRKGKLVQLLSNGYNLKDELLVKYKKAGLNKIYIHVDSMQYRDDHPKASSEREMNTLREKIAEKITRHGIYCGLSVTLYRETFHELPSIMDFVINSNHIKWLLMTCNRDFGHFAKIFNNIGTIEEHMTPGSKYKAGRPLMEFYQYLKLLHPAHISKFPEKLPWETDNYFQKEVTNSRIENVLKLTHGIIPFLYVGSNKDVREKRWLIYLLFTMEKQGEKSYYLPITPKFRKAVELFNYLHKKFLGSYPFEMCYTRIQSYLICLLYAFWTFELKTIVRTIKFLSLSMIKGFHISLKNIVFQELPYINDKGEFVHCRECPDATVRNGKIMPLCMADIVSPIKQVKQKEPAPQHQVV